MGVYMKIDVIKFEDEVIRYDELVKKYENTTFNLYHILKNTSLYWRDDRTNDFFDNLYSEKGNIDLVLEYLKQLSELYKYMLQKYKEIGNKIDYSLDLKSDINNKFNRLNIEIKKILKKYEELDVSSSIPENSLIINEKRNISRVKEKVEDIEDGVNNTFEKIDYVEKEVEHKIKSIEVKKINENDVLNLI